MGAKAGFGLKIVQWFIRGVQFLCAALILGVYSYFLSALHNHDLPIAKSVRAVEGISGAACLYTLAALVLLCCVAGLKFTSFLAIVLDVAFIGAFIYVAVANKGGASSCQGYVDTPFGSGKSGDTVQGDNGFTALPSFHTACRLQTAVMAVAIIAIFFFIFSILMEVALARHHHKEKRFGPGPKNNYTSGSGRSGGFFGRMFRRRGTAGTVANDNALPHHTQPDQLEQHGRHSYATEATAVGHPYGSGTTTGVTGDGYNKYETGYGHYPHGGAGGQLPAQTDSTAGPYGPPHNYRYEDGVYERNA